MKNFKLALSQRRIIIVSYDALCSIGAFYFAHSLRFESFNFSNFNSNLFLKNLLIASVVQILCFYKMGLHKGFWKFASMKDFILISKTTAIAIPLTIFSIFFLNRLESVPRSVFIIDAILLLLFIGGGRMIYRIISQHKSKNKLNKAILIGAGVAGEKLIREFNRNKDEFGFDIVGILDDDRNKHGRTLHGTNIVGDINQIPTLAKETSATTLFIAIAKINNTSIRKIYNLAKESNLQVNILPPLTDLLKSKISFKYMREVQVEDLLGRSLINLDQKIISDTHNNKTIIVTGAGGSIGSELCRQILKNSPKRLILIDNSEYNLYKMCEELSLQDHSSELIYKTVDIRNLEHLDHIISNYKPDIIYHAAAYKHVPMMENNPCSAIDINIRGTYNLARLSIKHSIDKFILISTDKAVNPTNVMGASKRVAEMICELHQKQSSKTTFSMVRFGNVLASSGSVVPKFKKQIAKGGPVTVTHPDVTRFFMAIPEAAQLVIQAGCLSKGGEIFILNMGTAVKIVDLAKDLITLSGYECHREIEIKFTGLRPGEKLHEELLAKEETTIPTSHDKVRVAQSRPIDPLFAQNLELILSMPVTSSNIKIKELLHEMVNEYTPQYQSLNTEVHQEMH